MRSSPDTLGCGCWQAHLALVAVPFRIVVEVGLLRLKLLDASVLEHFGCVERQHVRLSAEPPEAGRWMRQNKADSQGRDAREVKVGDVVPALPFCDAFPNVVTAILPLFRFQLLLH